MAACQVFTYDYVESEYGICYQACQVPYDGILIEHYIVFYLRKFSIFVGTIRIEYETEEIHVVGRHDPPELV